MHSRIWWAVVGLLVSAAAVVLALLLSMLIIALFGKDPFTAMEALYRGSFGGKVQIASTLNKTIPLVLVALGWIVAFTAGRINIGFVGQIVAGGIMATAFGVTFAGLPIVVHLPLALVSAMVGGAVWAGIAAWLWVRFQVNEIISTLLLNLVAIQILAWLVLGPLQEPARSFPRSSPVTESARWPTLLPATPLGWDLVMVIGVVVLVALLPRFTFGVELRLTGANPEAARYAGVRTVRVAVLALLISGALAGLAGSSLILAGDLKTLTSSFQGNYGFEGIVVALVARNSVLGVFPAALLLAGLVQGGGLMQALAGVPSSLVLVTDGLVILLVAGSAYFLRTPAVQVDLPPEEPALQSPVGEPVA
jgi:general nucleoside transport system permease protein